MTQFHY